MDACWRLNLGKRARDGLEIRVPSTREFRLAYVRRKWPRGAISSAYRKSRFHKRSLSTNSSRPAHCLLRARVAYDARRIRFWVRRRRSAGGEPLRGVAMRSLEDTKYGLKEHFWEQFCFDLLELESWRSHIFSF